MAERTLVLAQRGKIRLVEHQIRGYDATYQLQERSWSLIDWLVNRGWSVLKWEFDRKKAQAAWRRRIALEDEFDMAIVEDIRHDRR